MPVKSVLCRLLLLWFPGGEAMSATDIPKQTARTVAFSDVAGWSIGLLIVLSVFSLGMREKVILLQVGRKQLILGVTPGRIETLHVLEGDDCLIREETVSTATETGFAQKLLQAIKARTEHSRSGQP
jgi:flagellar protein FliO/FliZ